MNAKWIQIKGHFNKTHFYEFSKTFEIQGNLTVKVSASTRYKLYINNRFVCEGPCQGTEYEQYYEELDVTGFLKDGANEIRATVLHVADDTFTSAFTTPSPIFWLEGVQDGKIVLQTDKSWNACRIEGMEPFQGDFIMFSVCHFERHSAEYTKTPMEIEEGSEAFLDNEGANPFGLMGLLRLKKSPLPQMETHAFKTMQKTKTIENGYVLDAGQYTTAKVRVRVCGKKGDILRLSYAECYIKSNNFWDFKKGLRDDETGNIIGPSDYIELSGEEQEVEFWWYRAFRYIEVSCESPSDLKPEVTYAPYFYPFPITAEFSCSDERFNQMWNISIQTLLCCSHEIYVDCPFFEQQQYDMDSYLEAMYTLKICKDDRLVKKAISDLAQSQQPNGLLCANYPSRTTQIIPTFSIYWIMLLHDYYIYSGNKDFIKPFMGTVDKILCGFETLLDENGFVKSKYWPYLDWAGDWKAGVPNNGVNEPIAAYSMQYSMGLKCAEFLAEALERNGLAQEYHHRRTALNKSIQAHFWNAEAKYYNDTLTTKEFSQHTAIWAILAEIETGEKAAYLAKRMLEKDIVSCSFSMGFFLFRALEKTGLYDKAFPCFDGFLKMLDLHCTTWCENPDTPRSECHGWSATPLYEFTTGILGVKQTAVGFKAVEIAPQPGHLTFAQGKVSTPYGDISVAWKKQDETIWLKLKAPKEITITLGKNVQLY